MEKKITITFIITMRKKLNKKNDLFQLSTIYFTSWRLNGEIDYICTYLTCFLLVKSFLSETVQIDIFFSIFITDFFPWKLNSWTLWLWNFSWWSTLWMEKIFMRVVHFGFKNRQKVFFVSLKKHQKVDYLLRSWLFSNFLF